MTNTTTDRDSLGYRLAHILRKLNQGEKIDPQALATEFNVSLRTLQRDINQRFAFLPLEKVDGHYQLAAKFLGQLCSKATSTKTWHARKPFSGNWSKPF